MSKPHAFQLAYTIKAHKKIHESQADAARYHMRHHMGWTPHEHIQTTLLGHIPLASGTNEQKRTEAHDVMRKQIKEAFKALEVDHLITFTGSLMVNDLEDAIEVAIP